MADCCRSQVDNSTRWNAHLCAKADVDGLGQEATEKRPSADIPKLLELDFDLLTLNEGAARLPSSRSFALDQGKISKHMLG